MACHNQNIVCSPGLKPTPIATMMFKTHDLRRDVDCLQSIYDKSDDPNKARIERVLTNMKRKLHKTEQLMTFGKNALEYCVAEDRTRTTLNRVQKVKRLFKELIKGQGSLSNPERRSLSEMFHQLLSMEEDLVHFGDPESTGSTSGRCRSSGEPHWKPAKDCEVQALLLDDLQLSETASSERCSEKERIVCCTYPEIEEPSDNGEDETRCTVFSITNRREEWGPITSGVSDNRSWDETVKTDGTGGTKALRKI